MRKTKMDLRALEKTPPWEWPENAAAMILKVLQDPQTAPAERSLAAELAGDETVFNEELADALLAILRDDGESDELRGEAASALGPALELADTEGFDYPDDMPISEAKFHMIQEFLTSLYRDPSLGKVVRRRILEASVCAAQDWHPNAIRAAYSSGDEEWKLTAVFCMGYVRGFDAQILDALKSENPEIFREALHAAGTWGIERAWPHIAALLESDSTDKSLLLAAIDAVASIRTHEAAEILDGLTDSEDEEIAAAAHEAIEMAEGLAQWEEDEEEEEDDDERF